MLMISNQPSTRSLKVRHWTFSKKHRQTEKKLVLLMIGEELRSKFSRVTTCCFPAHPHQFLRCGTWWISVLSARPWTSSWTTDRQRLLSSHPRFDVHPLSWKCIRDMNAFTFLTVWVHFRYYSHRCSFYFKERLSMFSNMDTWIIPTA